MNTWLRLSKCNWIMTFSKMIWIWLMKAGKKDTEQSERLIIKKQRHSESDIEKGRARYRAAKRRKASLETVCQTDKGLWNEKETEGTRLCEAAGESSKWGSDLNFICFHPNRVWKVCLSVCLLVNHTVQVVHGNIDQKHRDAQEVCRSSWNVWHFKPPTCFITPSNSWCDAFNCLFL